MASYKFDNSKETARALNDLARHQKIAELYADILADMKVCEIEGWDKLEYIHLLQDLLNSLTKEVRK